MRQNLTLDTYQVGPSDPALTTNHDCERWNVTSGSKLDIEAGGTLGNFRMDNGQLVIGNGGVMWGFAEAGGSYTPSDANLNPNEIGLQTFGTKGDITVKAGGTLSAALIGPQSTLRVGEAGGGTPAVLGRLITSGTVTIDNAIVDISKYSYAAVDNMNAVITLNGGSTSIANSAIHGQQELVGVFYTIGPDSAANPDPYRLSITNSTIDNVTAGIVAQQELYPRYAPAPRPFYMDLADTSISADSSVNNAAVKLIQMNNLSPITGTIVGGTLSGGSGVIVSALTDNVSLAVAGTRLEAPVAGDGTTTQGIAAYVSGPAQVLFTNRTTPDHAVNTATTIVGALEGLRIDSSAAATGPTVTIAGGTQIQGQNGAAVHVTRQSGDPASWSAITVTDGATLAGKDGNIVQVDNGALSQLYTQGVALNGNIIATGADTTLLFGQGAASNLTGTISAASGATLETSLDGATVTGNMLADGPGTVLDTQIGAGGTLNGNVLGSNQASLWVAASAPDAVLNGAVVANTGTAQVNAVSGGRITGGVQLLGGATGTVAVDGADSSISRADGPAVAVAGGSRADISLSNGGQIASAAGSLLDVSGGSQASLQVANSMLTGDLTRDAGSTLNVSLTDGASLTGNMSPQSLSIDNGAVWNVANSAAPTVGALTMNNGRINFDSADGPFRTLTAASLSGSNGSFGMGVDFTPRAGNDLLAITGAVSGAHILDPYDDNQGISNPRDHVVVARTGGGGDFSLQGGLVDAGIYTYKLVRHGNTWVLERQSDSNNGDGGDGNDGDGDDGNGNGNGNDGNGNGGDNPPTPSPDDLSPAAKTALSVAAATPFVWYNELSTLRLRQGDLRDNHAGDGLWVRTFSSSNQVAKAAAPAFDLDQYGVMLGADKRLVLRTGDLYVGGFGSYSYSQSDINGGSTGRMDSYGLGAYATWLLPDGWYLDTVIKANSFNTDLRVRGSDGRTSSGNATMPGLGASVEIGKTIALPNNGFLEPYAQIAAFAARSDTTKLDNGFNIDTGSTRSVQGQLGVLAGQKFDWGSHGFVQPYMKFAAITEFIDDNEVTLNNHVFNNDTSGTRALVGAGVAAQVKQNLQFHADVDYSSGGPLDRSVRWNLGLRYVW